ncbi:MAG: CRTAC1 family protein, partial [Acidobacteria bacterium]|nr:CRTAC1 family protein [Acidobacteriota bacterium]
LYDPTRLRLSADSVAHLRTWLDLVTLTALGLSDHDARLLNRREIGPELFVTGWADVTRAHSRPSARSEAIHDGERPADFSFIHALIDEKIRAFEAYNEISMPVFMRNLQVFFSRYQWPEDEATGEAIKIAFNESMIAFMTDLLLASAALADEEEDPFIRLRHVDEALQRFTPYEVNEYEDVIFFPRLPSSDQIAVEAYDTDSFRDSGLHWRYLGEALGELRGELSLAPDPFAAELLTEGVAQFGVLVLRASGIVAKRSDAESLSIEHMKGGFDLIQDRLARHTEAPENQNREVALASSSEKTSRELTFFENVSEQSGIEFEHRTSDWLSRTLRSYLRKSESEGILTIPPAFGGAGIAADDLDGDGDSDLLILSGAGNKLYRNNGNGTFDDVTGSSPVSGLRRDNTYREPRQPIIADFDNDGRPDILITYVGENHGLYRNLGKFRFEDLSESSGLGGEDLVAGPATVFDFNRDGLLDVYIGYFGNYLKGVLPTLNRRNENGLPNALFVNRDGFSFEDVTGGSGTDNGGWAQALSHTDLDGDGWQDLIVGNDFGINAYLRNLGDGTFEDVSAEIGTDKPSFTMNVGIADLNDDDRPDIYISNIVTMVKDEKYVLPDADTRVKLNPEKMARMRVVEANDLFISETGDQSMPTWNLSDRVGRGFSSTGWSWDADFFDFDLDGDDDLYCLNGMNEYMVYTETPYYSPVQNSVEKIFLPVSDREANVFFVNEGGTLGYASPESGLDYLGNSRSAVYLDLEGDGDLDVVVNNYQGPALVYRNDVERHGRNWMEVKLVGNPERGSNRDAVGARLIATADDGSRVWREIHGSEGYLSVHPRTQHFGLGGAGKVDLEIRWPNGDTQLVKDLEANRRHIIEQE